MFLLLPETGRGSLGTCGGTGRGGVTAVIPRTSLSWVGVDSFPCRELRVPDASFWAWKGRSSLEEGVFVSEHIDL